MGLDQYLTLTNKKYKEICDAYDAYYGLSEEEQEKTVCPDLPDDTSFDEITLVNLNAKPINCELIYWRKANMIHNWFVENVQNGVDDCGSYRVSIEQLKSLRDICQYIVDNLEKYEIEEIDWRGNPVKVTEYSPKNEELIKWCEENLPTCSGFFFGSTDYDKWYFHDVVYTLEEIENVINRFENSVIGLTGDNENYGIFYHSSW